MKKQVVSFLMAGIISVSALMPINASADKWVKASNGYQYEYTDGTYAKTGWLTVDKNKYYIQKDGTRKIGWLTSSSGAKYFFDNDGIMKHGLIQLTSGYYYFDKKTGKLLENVTIEIKNEDWYFGYDGKYKGTIKLDGDNVYIYSNNKKLVSWTTNVALYNYYYYYDSNEDIYCTLKFYKYGGDFVSATFKDGTTVTDYGYNYYITDGDYNHIGTFKYTEYNPWLGTLPSINASNYKKKSETKTKSSTSSSTSKTVYVTSTGKKYHYSSTCNGGTYYSSTLSAAQSRGLTACNKCT